MRSGLSVERLSEVTRIRRSVIDGLERDDFEACGGDFYARGHIRTLARATGVDPDPLVAEYDATIGGASTPRATQIFASPRRSIEYRRPNWTMAMGFAVVIVLVFAFVQLAGGPASDDREEAASRVTVNKAPPAPATHPVQAAPPAPIAPVVVTPTFPPGVTVVLKAVDGRSRVRAFDSKGKKMFETVLAKGESRTVSDPVRVRLGIGNSGAVRLTVNGKDVGAAGEDGTVVDRTFVPGDPTPRSASQAPAGRAPEPAAKPSVKPSPQPSSKPPVKPVPKPSTKATAKPPARSAATVSPDAGRR